LFWIPGRVPVGFAGDHELRQLLRVTASSALLSGPVLLWMLRRRPEGSGTILAH
jgi:hypothetical protein